MMKYGQAFPSGHHSPSAVAQHQLKNPTSTKLLAQQILDASSKLEEA
jgi:hypothetical protein